DSQRFRPTVRLELVPLLDWTGYRARVQVEGRWRRRSSSGGRRSGRLSYSFSLIRGEKKLVRTSRRRTKPRCASCERRLASFLSEPAVSCRLLDRKGGGARDAGRTAEGGCDAH